MSRTILLLLMVVVAGGILLALFFENKSTSQNANGNVSANATHALNSNASTTVVQQLCAKRGNVFFLETCTNENVNFYAVVPDTSRIVDAGTSIFRSDGTLIVNCGGFGPVPSSSEVALCAQYPIANCAIIDDQCEAP